jgi:hypothetical protein
VVTNIIMSDQLNKNPVKIYLYKVKMTI